jgi:hypothetical protein
MPNEAPAHMIVSKTLTAYRAKVVVLRRRHGGHQDHLLSIAYTAKPRKSSAEAEKKIQGGLVWIIATTALALGSGLKGFDFFLLLCKHVAEDYQRGVGIHDSKLGSRGVFPRFRTEILPPFEDFPIRPNGDAAGVEPDVQIFPANCDRALDCQLIQSAIQVGVVMC